MNTLFLDCSSGISGDMTIAALLDLGIPLRRLESELGKLGLAREYHLHVGRKKQQQLTGVRFDVHSAHHHNHDGHGHAAEPPHRHEHGRGFAEIRRLIEKSRLSPFVRKHAVSLFRRIAVVEGKLHGRSPEKVHFHEVGAIDSIVDIVGVCVLIEELNPDQILASAPCDGHGFIECAHGRLPVPTPATLELLKGIPLRQIDVQGELITPTGAVILAEFVAAFGPLPVMTVDKIGYGLGSRTYPNHPNVLRALWGQAGPAQAVATETAVDVLETNVDDVAPEILAAAMERLLAAGARDVFLTPILMKKGRPATMITVLAEPADTQRLARSLLYETGTFGMRIRRAERICLARESRRVKTRLGTITIKLGRLDGCLICAKPEFESCRQLADRLKKPVRITWAAALAECSKILLSQHPLSAMLKS